MRPAPRKSSFGWCRGARHAMSYAVAHGEYVRRVRAFLASAPWRGAQAAAVRPLGAVQV